MRTSAALFGLFSLAFAVKLDLTGRCAGMGGVGVWECDQYGAGVVCAGNILDGAGSPCTDCVALSTPGFFDCSST